MRSVLKLSYVGDLLALIGFAGVTIGCWWIYEPAGMILGGLGIFALGILTALRR